MEIARWDKWQTYRKDRSTPPWIKVYRNLLSNEEWASLTDAEKGQLVSMWILAADKNGSIPNNPTIIKRMAMLETEPNINKFIDLGFLVGERLPSDDQVVTKSPQHDAPETETETETETEQTLVAKSTTKPRKKKTVAPSSFVWQSYSDAYYQRYNVEPVRNATVNGQLSNFIKRVPIDEAPHIAAFYVSHNNSFYVTKMHPIGIMLSDSEKLRTEWATNTQMTKQTAQQVDQRQSVSNTAIEAQRIFDARQK